MQRTGIHILDLLQNEYFVQWVIAPTDESTHYWMKWMQLHPDRKQDVEMAVGIVRSGKYRIDEAMPEAHYDQVLENIVNYSLKAKQRDIRPVRSIWRPLGVAAAVSLLLAAALYLVSLAPGVNESDLMVQMVEKAAPAGTKVTTRLPDGSKVTLNAGSRIIFPEKYTASIREVQLVGEAFFEVEHDADKPFQVKMNGDVVRVLGTSFNIRSYPEDELVHVAVATGRVSYTVPGGEQVVLSPDQMATYRPRDGQLTTGVVDRLSAFGWKDKIIYFKSTPFDQIIKELERWYGVEIHVTGNFGGIGTFSGEFHNESLEEVLKGLSFVYRFNFKIEGTHITLIQITT